MVKFNVLVFFLWLHLSIVFECRPFTSTSYRNRCSLLQINRGRVRLRSSGRVARITCYWPFKIVHGDGLLTCVRGEWDKEPPICARSGCPIEENYIAHGRINVVNEGAKLELMCDEGYAVDGPSFIYCNERLLWNEQLKGCKEQDEIYLSCDFESPDQRFCGWRNYILNDVDWLADKTSTFFLGNFRHVPPGSSQYFNGNYISLDAGNYGTSTFGRLLSPPLLPAKSKLRCLIFSYKVMSGSSNGIPTLTVFFGGIPHWVTSAGEGIVIIGLYQFNVTSEIIIEGKNCKAAIDNMVITEANGCVRYSNEEEVDSCHDNCGQVTNGNGCSCDWECHYNNNCCPDIQITCPYIQPLEEIARLYLTTTKTTPIKVTTTVKQIVSSSTDSIAISSSKLFNESKMSNDTIIVTTPINEYNITINKITTTNYITQPILISSIKYPTFSPKSPITSTIKPTTITMALPSTETFTKIPMKNISSNFNSTSIHQIIPISTTTSLIPKTFITTSNILVNISTISAQLFDTLNATSIRPPIISTSFTKKLANTPSIPTKTFMDNITSLNSIGISTPSSITKPLVINTHFPSIQLNTTSRTTKDFMNISTSTTPLSINTSNSTNKPLTITQSFSSTQLINLPRTSIKSNISKSVKQLSNTFITKTPNTLNSIITESKPKFSNATTRDPIIVKYLNSPTVPYKKMNVIDIFQPNSDLNTVKYNKSFKNHTILLNSNMFPIVTTESTNRTELKFEKPELNYSLHNQHMLKVKEWLTEHVKQNDNAKSFNIFDTVSIIKYIVAISVILIVFKYTLSFILWYFKEPVHDDMNACFIETNAESFCDIELTPNCPE